MKISKRVRDEAIEAARIAASNRGDMGGLLQTDAASDLLGSTRVVVCRIARVDHVDGDCPCVPIWWGEVESLLRDGWSPGDPVVRL